MLYISIGFNALISVLFIVAGLILKHKPPSQINMIYGYRTFRSMKNIDLWHEGNKISAEMMIRYGAILFCFGTLVCFLIKQTSISIFVNTGLMIVLIISMIFRVENRLKQLDTK